MPEGKTADASILRFSVPRPSAARRGNLKDIVVARVTTELVAPARWASAATIASPTRTAGA
eukprot:6923370-Alexandrium_andersonii.AAC.1